MASIRGKDSKPEMAVRRLMHSLGFRHRLHRRDLPGRPDMAYPRHRLALFVHGCFWHSHLGCPKASIPATNTDFWRTKLARNVERDHAVEDALRSEGWRVVVIWECETKNAAALGRSLSDLLEPCLLKPRKAP